MRVDIELQCPTTLEDAVGLARAFEHRNATPNTAPGGSRFTRPPPARTSPTPKTSAPIATPPATQLPVLPSSHPKPAPGTRFTRLTPEVMAQRRVDGLCYICPAKFSLEHIKDCPMRGIYLLEVVGETTVVVDDDITDDGGISISLNALTGITTSMMMHLDIALAGEHLRALVDSGSTHCFVARATARRLGLTPTPRPGMTVGVANGERVACSGIYTNTPVIIGNEPSTLTSTSYL